MSEKEWQVLDGLNSGTSKFPARAKLDDDYIIILQTPKGFRGIQRTCPHQQATMMDSLLVGNGAMVRCAQHSFTFKLADGKGVNCPGYKIKVYEVKEENGGLLARSVE